MKSLFLIALAVLPTAAFAADNAEMLPPVEAPAVAPEDAARFERYQAYKQRRAERRAYALEARREYNATKGPHVYRTAIAVSAPITPFIAIEKGWVHQPAIPIRPWVAVGYSTPYVDVAPVHHTSTPVGYTLARK